MDQELLLNVVHNERKTEKEKRLISTKNKKVAKESREIENAQVEQIEPLRRHNFEKSRNIFPKELSKKSDPTHVRKDDRFRTNKFRNTRSKNEQSGSKPHPSGPKNFGASSSLFFSNPEIPIIKLEKQNQKVEDVFTKSSYNDLDFLHPHLIKCLKDRTGVTEMTKVQQLSIPLLLSGRDCLIKSATGSGKTLAYAIPIVQQLQAMEPKITRSDGLFALILVPTRELVMQSYESIELLCKSFARIVPGCLMGGEKKKSEKARIRKGINILVATPGRLIDHMQTTENLKFDKLKYLVIDEADRLYEQGFEETISKIISHIHEVNEHQKPQTMLLSATLSEGVQHLAGMSLTKAKFADASHQKSGENSYVLPPNLKQHFTIVPAKLRLVTLCAFITNECAKKDLKCLIFVSSQDLVDFHSKLFTTVLSPLLKNSNLSKEVKFLQLHGNMLQKDRMQVFQEFRDSKAGILLCTDVASRGLDLPKVDWIVQYNCPATAEDYVHRVGRTARIGEKGNSVIFLLPSEVKFLSVLQERVEINLEPIDAEKLLNGVMLIKFEDKVVRTRSCQEYASHLQMEMENATYDEPPLLDIAKKAFLAYGRAYASYPLATKDVLPFKGLHFGHLAKSFCLRDSPRSLGAYAKHMKLLNPRKERKVFRNPPLTSKKRKMSEFDSGTMFKKK